MLKKVISYLQLSRDRVRRWLGLALFDAKQSKITEIEHLNKIVLLRWDAKWGDAIVSSFIFDAIRDAYPNVQIELVTTPHMAELFENYYQVDKVYQIKKRPKYAELKKLAQDLGEVDVLVHLSPYLKMKDIYFLSKVQAKVIAGLDDEVNLINTKLGAATKGVHFAEKFEMLLSRLGIKVNNTHYRVPLNQKSIQQVEQLVINQGAYDLTVINPFGSGGSRKMLPATIAKLVELVLIRSPETKIALLHSPETESDVVYICERDASGRVFYNPQSSSIYDAIALVQKANRVISVDTAIVHIASGLSKPLLAIYNPDHENFLAWHPNSECADVVFADKCNPADINQLDWKQMEQSVDKLFERTASA